MHRDRLTPVLIGQDGPERWPRSTRNVRDSIMSVLRGMAEHSFSSKVREDGN